MSRESLKNIDMVVDMFLIFSLSADFIENFSAKLYNGLAPVANIHGEIHKFHKFSQLFLKEYLTFCAKNSTCISDKSLKIVVLPTLFPYLS